MGVGGEKRVDRPQPPSSTEGGGRERGKNMLTDRQLLDLIHRMTGDDFVQDLAMHALPDYTPSHDTAARLMREASERLGEIYAVVHGHLPTPCHDVHQDWRDKATAMHAALLPPSSSAPAE